MEWKRREGDGMVKEGGTAWRRKEGEAEGQNGRAGSEMGIRMG